MRRRALLQGLVAAGVARFTRIHDVSLLRYVASPTLGMEERSATTIGRR